MVKRNQPLTADTGARPLHQTASSQSRQDATLSIRAVWTDEALKRIIDEMVVPALVDEYLRVTKVLPEARTHEP